MRKAWRRASTKFEHLVAPPAAIVLREALKTGDERRALKIYHARDKRGRTLCEEMHPSMPFSSDDSGSDRIILAFVGSVIGYVDRRIFG